MRSLTPARLMCAAGLLALASVSPAGVILHTDHGAFLDALEQSVRYGFEDQAKSSAVSGFQAGPIGVTVETTAPVNRIIEGKDGYGAIAHEGDLFWKLRGGTTTLVFDRPILGFGFFYSDVEKSNLHIAIPGEPEVVLDDHNPNNAKFLGLESDEPFDRLSITWSDNRNDGVGFDSLTLGGFELVPTPGGIAILSAAGAFAVMRRRR